MIRRTEAEPSVGSTQTRLFQELTRFLLDYTATGNRSALLSLLPQKVNNGWKKITRRKRNSHKSLSLYFPLLCSMHKVLHLILLHKFLKSLVKFRHQTFSFLNNMPASFYVFSHAFFSHFI